MSPFGALSRAPGVWEAGEPFASSLFPGIRGAGPTPPPDQRLPEGLVPGGGEVGAVGEELLGVRVPRRKEGERVCEPRPFAGCCRQSPGAQAPPAAAPPPPPAPAPTPTPGGQGGGIIQLGRRV